MGLKLGYVLTFVCTDVGKRTGSTRGRECNQTGKIDAFNSYCTRCVPQLLTSRHFYSAGFTLSDTELRGRFASLPYPGNGS